MNCFIVPFFFRSAQIADENCVKKKKLELCCTLDQVLYFHRLIILQWYVKPSRPLLFVHPRRRSPPIGQVRSSPHALKGRWGLRAFKRRASAHSSFCVTPGTSQVRGKCVWCACVYRFAWWGHIHFRAAFWATDRCASPAKLMCESIRSIKIAKTPAKLFGAFIDRQCVPVVSSR